MHALLKLGTNTKMSQDFYKILGVNKGADAKEIKSAYRKLAKQHHPDQNKDDAKSVEKFKEINAAYEVLSDTDKRAAYDSMGHAAFEAGGMNGSAGGAGAGFQGFGGSFSDIFEDMFGEMHGRSNGRSRHQGATRGSDIQYRVNITLEEAFHGKETKITYPVNSSCDECGGSGAAKGSGNTTCDTCAGRGKIRQQQGFFTIERTCHACNGAGTIIKDPCSACQGGGQVRKQKNLKVKIPAGIESGQRIRLSGEGEGGLRGGRNGDLYVLITVKPHKIFERNEGSSLYCKMPISITTAALGGVAKVPTIDGSGSTIKIPQGSQTGQRLRLKGKGMTIAGRNATRGDMFVDLVVEVPVNLTKKQKDLLEDFAKTLKHEKNSPQSSGFIKKVKEIWSGFSE